MLTTECARSGCHGGTKPADNLLLTKDAVYSELVNVASSCNGKLLVKPGAVADSYIINKLTGVGMCSGTLMPKADQKLLDSQINIIRSWICQGAPKN